MTATANGNRRQLLLLGLLGVSVLAFLWFKGGLVVASGGVDALPPIDLGGLDVKLKEISTVDPHLLPPGGRPDTRPERNLFQYGVPKPPPVDPAEVERQRIAAQQALEAQEKAAREQKAREIAEQRMAALTPPPPQIIVPYPPPPPEAPKPPPKPTPPPIKFKFMGMMGPANKTLGVFLDADNILLARKGEVIQGKFRVIDIGVEWADIGYTDPAFKDQKKRLQFGQ